MFSRNYLFLLYTIPYLIRIGPCVHLCVRQSAQKRLEPFQPIFMREPALTKQFCDKNSLLERSGYTKEECKKVLLVSVVSWIRGKYYSLTEEIFKCK